jgi:hypothetical protein
MALVVDPNGAVIEAAPERQPEKLVKPNLRCTFASEMKK